MTSASASSPEATTFRVPSIPEWKAIVSKYQTPSVASAVWQMSNTLIPFFALWALAVWGLDKSLWITLGASVLMGLFLVRVFIIFHDCGHGSYFKNKRANDAVGFITGLLTFTPYFHWRWEHALHHSTCGDLERRGVGDVWTMTVKEYLASSPAKKALYRFMRNPFVLFLLAPPLLFVVYQRFSSRTASPREKYSVWWMNVALLAMTLLFSWAISAYTGGSFLEGLKYYLLIQLPAITVAGTLGVWMFYVQHQYEDVYWDHHEEWDFTRAALQGSSFYKLPKILQWFTGNIGFHHIHHLSARIPNYHLERCHNSHEVFRQVEPLTFWSSLKSMHLRLWDEDQRKLVGYEVLRSVRNDPPPAGGLTA